MSGVFPHASASLFYEIVGDPVELNYQIPLVVSGEIFCGFSAFYGNDVQAHRVGQVRSDNKKDLVGVHLFRRIVFGDPDLFDVLSLLRRLILGDLSLAQSCEQEIIIL
jgi:hypothetical protein